MQKPDGGEQLIFRCEHSFKRLNKRFQDVQFKLHSRPLLTGRISSRVHRAWSADLAIGLVEAHHPETPISLN